MQYLVFLTVQIRNSRLVHSGFMDMGWSFSSFADDEKAVVWFVK